MKTSFHYYYMKVNPLSMKNIIFFIATHQFFLHNIQFHTDTKHDLTFGCNITN